MPLTSSGKKVLGEFREEYGEKKGTSVFYASLNKGTLPAKLHQDDACAGYMDACRRGDAAGIGHHSAAMLRGRIVR